MVNSDNTGFSINFNAGSKNVQRTGPGVPRKTHKNFEQVLRKEEREERRQQEDESLVKGDKGNVKKKEAFDEAYFDDDVAVAPKKNASSIFDLKQGELKQPSGAPAKEFSEELQQGSLSALFKGLGTKEKLAALQKQVNAEEPVDTAKIVIPSKYSDSLKSNVSTEFTREQPDLAMVNPLSSAQSIQSNTHSQVGAAQRTSISEMQEMVDQIVAKLYTLSVSGKTDTTISLKHPPMFAGANLIVTAFDSAKGEFNITFENLTQAAKQMLEMQQNNDALKSALNQKGFVVHILTATTTTIEPRPIFEGEPLARQDQGEEGKEQGKQRDEENEREG